jgi:short-subunit dehydrogenase
MKSNSILFMKNIFITGATSGIGLALVRAYHREGASVYFCGRRRDRLLAIEQELNQIRPQSAKGFVVDVTHEKDFIPVLDHFISKKIKLDLVVANAGFGVFGKFESLSNSDYQRQFETNVFGVMNSVRPFLSLLKVSRGQVAIVGSGNSYIALPTVSPYCMSKFAVRAFADSLRGELHSDGVTVTLICPGFVESEIRHLDHEGRLDPNKKDEIPSWLVVSADRAAGELMRGLKKRKAELWITGHIKPIILLEMILPGVMRWIKNRVQF